MKIRSFAHRRLKDLYVDDETKGLPADAVDKLRKMLAFLQEIESESELRSIPIWKAHKLSGGRKASWSLHVTRNWRLTFWIDSVENEIRDVNFEDYH